MNTLRDAIGLLNAQAPEGEFLAYINPDEAKMLKDAGGAGLLTPQGIPSYFTAAQRESRMGGSSISPGTDTRGGNRNNNSGGGGDNNREQYGAVTQYTTTPQAMGTVNAEDEYLAPDNDHFKATQKAIKQTNEELRELGLDKSDYTDWTDEEKDTYQKEMNKLKGTEGVNYSFYKGNEGTTNLSFQEHFKDVEATNPVLAKSPTFRFLIAAGRTLVENSTTDYGTYKYGGSGTDGSGRPVDKGGWIGRVFNSDGTVNENLTDNEINDLYNQAQAELPFIIGNTDPQESMVNKFFDNMGNNLGVSSAYLDTYNAAKDKISQSLNLQPITSQFGFGNTFNQNFDRSMTSANPFFEELTNQGLI